MFNKTAVYVEQRHTAGAGEHCCRAAAGSLAFTNDTFLSMHVNPPLHPLSRTTAPQSRATATPAIRKMYSISYKGG